MAAIANIVVPDAAGTPVNHTFAPQKVANDTAQWQEKSASTPQGYWNLITTVKEPVNGGTAYRVTKTFDMTFLKTYVDLSGNSITAVDYVVRRKEEWLLPIKSTLQNRKDAHKLNLGIDNDSQLQDMIWNLNRPY